MTQGLIGIVGGLAGLAGLVASVFVLSPLVLPLLMVAALPLYVGTRILSKREFNFIVEQVPRVRIRDYIRSLQVEPRSCQRGPSIRSDRSAAGEVRPGLPRLHRGVEAPRSKTHDHLAQLPSVLSARGNRA